MSLKVAGRLVFRSIHLPGTEQHVVLVAIALVDKRGDTLRAVLVQRLPELGTTRGKDPAHRQRNRAWAEHEVDPHRCAEVSPCKKLRCRCCTGVCMISDQLQVY